MKKNYIIDGYNLGYKIPSISKWITTGETERAIQLIKNYINKLGRQANQIILVFDGLKESHGGDSKQGILQIKFSRKPQTADDIIRQFIRSQKNASHWIVVSSDSEIRFTAEDMGAKAISSEIFIASLRPNRNRSQTKINKEKYQPENIDINYWLDQFNQSGDKS